MSDSRQPRNDLRNDPRNNPRSNSNNDSHNNPNNAAFPDVPSADDLRETRALDALTRDDTALADRHAAHASQPSPAAATPQEPASAMDGAPVIDFDKFKPTRSYTAARKRKDVVMRVLIVLAFIVACIPLISVLWTTIVNGVHRFNWDFLSHNMTNVIGGEATATNGYGGILHAIIGTLEITAGAMVISIPVGIMCSVFLTEYRQTGRLSRMIHLLVDVMSGIPSIVAGLFAFSMFAIIAGPGTLNGFEGSVALSLLMIPTVVKTTEEMLRIVPNDLREASLALGVTKQRTITKVVLRTALPGIVSGSILAIARVIGETAPLLMTAGYIVSTNANLFSGQMTTLPVFVYQEYSKLRANCPANADASCVTTIPMERAWAAALMLILIVLVLNLIGRIIARVFSVKTK
ncbi:phosphate ABC transporter, permease protein PstA [Bifidobacterium gallicum DSM 20093 = LMG 11596]|uniref:Phosphate transport system permease protein PstA n=2 Tax=Bifidobacterium gallicum TaxID=78342 RepID=D1NVI6_9BIFI|nr:phosphate ABC transporter, permease protein PstA [Bifidobacterium gallicum DSM 20093 = LMG 11596]KFI59451.1 phosphate ABC transporter substrate-binding protein [Bifidobacterium gallicum DSM 20093 = LMG 11596]